MHSGHELLQLLGGVLAVAPADLRHRRNMLLGHGTSAWQLPPTHLLELSPPIWQAHVPLSKNKAGTRVRGMLNNDADSWPDSPGAFFLPHQDRPSVAANAQHHGHTLLAKVLSLELGGCERLLSASGSCGLAASGVSLFWDSSPPVQRFSIYVSDSDSDSDPDSDSDSETARTLKALRGVWAGSVCTR